VISAEKEIVSIAGTEIKLQIACTDANGNSLVLSSKFIVYTDNNPLTYVLSSAKLDATTQRWIAALPSYNFEIKYRPGVNNADAAFLFLIEDSS
jgi:hypothetical protein